MIQLKTKNKIEEYEDASEALKRIITLFRGNPKTFQDRFLGIQTDIDSQHEGKMIAKVLEALVIGEDPTELRKRGLSSLIISPEARAKMKRINNFRNK